MKKTPNKYKVRNSSRNGIICLDGWIFFLSRYPLSQVPLKNDEEEDQKAEREANTERTASGRVQRASAQVANFHLAEIANNELPKDWLKRRFQSDLVPDDQKVRTAGGTDEAGRSVALGHSFIARS